MSQYRQGDVLIEEVDCVPTDAKPASSPIFAYGEVTGHCHRLDTDTFCRWDHEGSSYMTPDVDSNLVHEEHGAIPLKAGKVYRISRQRQFNPILGIPKPVID